MLAGLFGSPRIGLRKTGTPDTESIVMACRKRVRPLLRLNQSSRLGGSQTLWQSLFRVKSFKEPDVPSSAGICSLKIDPVYRILPRSVEKKVANKWGLIPSGDSIFSTARNDNLAASQLLFSFDTRPFC